MKDSRLLSALEKLRNSFMEYDWTYYDVPGTDGNEKMYHWPGKESEDIIIMVWRHKGEPQLFHRHNYFYFNYVYKGEYECLSCNHDRRVTLHKNDIYAGQPFAGHALMLKDNTESTSISVLIKPDVMYNYFLPSLSAYPKMIKFLLEPTTNSHSEEFMHFNVQNDDSIRALLEMMAVEYADSCEDSQDILRPLVLAYLINIARQYTRNEENHKQPKSLMSQVVKYISEHIDTVTLKGIADRFSYHPNYISALIRKETGKTFSDILLEQRMQRAVVILKGTNLPVEKISSLLGYSNPSNFHKAFREYYHMSPREYIQNAHCDMTSR